MLVEVLRVVGVLAAAVVGFVALSYLGLVLAGYEEMRRSKRLERDAARGWRHQRSDPTLLDRFRRPPFDVGRDAAATDVYRGQHRGRPFVAFQYAAKFGAGPDEERLEYAVLAVELEATFPPLALVPTNPPLRHVGADPGTEVTLDHPQLEPWFAVRSPDPAFARAVLGEPAVRDAVLGIVPPSGWWLADGTALVLRQGRSSPTQVAHALELVSRLLAGVPPELWRR